MQTPEMSPGQKAVEARYAGMMSTPVDASRTPVEVFGEMEQWIFTLGEYRLFLNPVAKRWYVFDRAHNDWKDLNAPAGSVVFVLKGGEPEMIPGGTGTSVPSPAPPAGTHAHQFCNQCGASLKPGLKFCSNCGAKVP